MTRHDHLLLILAEECAEVAQRASKALRFGIEEKQPGQNKTNGERLQEEMVDLYAVWEMIVEEIDEVPSIFVADLQVKRLKVEKFMKYSKECGRLK
jgi:hypothetical protein